VGPLALQAVFDIVGVVADASDVVVRLSWTYTTAEGSLGGEHTLQLPAGSEPLAKISKAKLIEWLRDQLGNTEEQLAEGIKANAAAAAKAAGEKSVPVPA
jgi:hypothetical protein